MGEAKSNSNESLTRPKAIPNSVQNGKGSALKNEKQASISCEINLNSISCVVTNEKLGENEEKAFDENQTTPKAILNNVQIIELDARENAKISNHSQIRPNAIPNNVQKKELNALENAKASSENRTRSNAISNEVHEKEFLNIETNRKASIISETRSNVSSKRRKTPQAARVMHNELLLILAINVVRASLEQLLLFIGDSSDQACNHLSHALVILNAITIHFCIVFLWLRQYVFYFYTNPLMKKFRPKGLQCISFAIYFEIMAGSGVTCMSIYIWWRDYTTADGLCPLTVSTEISPLLGYGPIILSVGATQISITYLFIFPIVSYKNYLKRGSNGAEDLAHSTVRLLKCLREL